MNKFSKNGFLDAYTANPMEVTEPIYIKQLSNQYKGISDPLNLTPWRWCLLALEGPLGGLTCLPDVLP